MNQNTILLWKEVFFRTKTLSCHKNENSKFEDGSSFQIHQAAEQIVLWL
jgi:shikimate 5-dehydrogenase